MYLIKTGIDEITDIETGAIFTYRHSAPDFIERQISESIEANQLQSMAGDTDESTARIWQHLESLCKFDATKEPAPKPEPTAHKYAPLVNPKVGDTVYHIKDLADGKEIPYVIQEVNETGIHAHSEYFSANSEFRFWTAIPL